MRTSTLVSEQEYLATVYHPDRDYVEGVLLDRNVGKKAHSKAQRQTILWFGTRRNKLNLGVFPEQRLAVKPNSYRVPDVCVVKLPEPAEEIFTQPPYICFEILSPDDTFPRLQERLDDYLAMGVPNIWVVDPASQRAWSVTREGHFEATDGVLKTADSALVVPVAELFADG